MSAAGNGRRRFDGTTVVSPACTIPRRPRRVAPLSFGPYHRPAARRSPSRVLNSSLLQRVAAGEAEAVRECIARYSGLVWSLARQFCASAAEAEDAVQEIFISLWRSAATFDPAVASERSEERRVGKEC